MCLRQDILDLSARLKPYPKPGIGLTIEERFDHTISGAGRKWLDDLQEKYAIDIQPRVAEVLRQFEVTEGRKVDTIRRVGATEGQKHETLQAYLEPESGTEPPVYLPPHGMSLDKLAKDLFGLVGEITAAASKTSTSKATGNAKRNAEAVKKFDEIRAAANHKVGPKEAAPRVFKEMGDAFTSESGCFEVLKDHNKWRDEG
ncbi:hypothetical protein [Terriglobus aquaticus]|uniref:Uncharacterized protein n=2 Tax=Terriglobus aquaticus TaxID=940139 RepID=A0ABW9KGR6_9BACT